jgi:CMP-N-acetylneuraminic acid synthetase
MIAALIPAKKNSTRLVNKNKRIIKGKPLFQHSIESAKKSKKIKKIFVSSNDKEILLHAKKLNCELIFRPEKISKEKTPMNDVIKHFISHLESKRIFVKHIVLLQPTSPFRKKNLLDTLISKFLISKKTLVTVKKENVKFLKGIIKIKKNFYPIFPRFFNTNDQELPKYYVPNGSVYIFNVKSFKKNNSIPVHKISIYEMFGKYNSNIDTLVDLKNVN